MIKEKQKVEIVNEIVNECGKAPCLECKWCDQAAFAHAEAIYNAGYRKIPDNIGEFSDGYHTFNELYHHRAVLFSVICNMFPEKAWKSKLHDTGDMYDGMFIVGIETERGQATYHYDIEPYWDMFKVKELEKAPKWDGHTPSVAIERIGNMTVKGYRKQSDIANDIITDLQRMWRIGRLNDTKHGIDVYVISQRDFHTIINELKKKYTEGEGLT